ncbi:PAS domain-containing protein [Sphingobium aquiterrae]|uniref:PAS domain-containing protein n=1 Tax=Sphingobium aquiterrae TaxID=2038656 RepID=UPI003017C69A
MQGNLPGQVVSATSFVRNFASYARSALGSPVHILNHGQVGLSLIATDLFLRYSAARPGSDDEGRMAAKLDIVLDVVPTLVVITDDRGDIVRVNPAARRYLQLSAEAVQGIALSEILSDQSGHLVTRALERVRDTGMAEVFEIDLTEQRVNTFRVTVTRFPGGFAVLADEIAHRLAVRELEARAMAYETLIDGLPDMARGTINIRGMVTAASPALAALVQADESRIVGLRFAALFDAASRSDITDAVETLLTGGRPFAMSADLLGRGARTTPVCVSAAPLVTHDKGSGAIFLLGKAGDPDPAMF